MSTLDDVVRSLRRDPFARISAWVTAYRRQHRIARVYRRWNHPLLRADMHSRKCEKGRT